MVCYDIFCSGQFAVHRHTYTLVKNNKAVCKAPKKFECQLVTVYSFREPQWPPFLGKHLYSHPGIKKNPFDSLVKMVVSRSMILETFKFEDENDYDYEI